MECRNPVAAVAVGEALVVVCSDGSVWSAGVLAQNPKWMKHKPIPGSEAEAEDGN
jgi:hypothetical protein